MPRLEDKLPLKSAQDYPAPRYPGRFLPLVYGELCDAPDGLWEAVCLDTTQRIYALAGHPLLAPEQGNPVTLFDREGRELGRGYTLRPSHDYQGRGPIATVAFPALTASDISFDSSDNSINSASGAFGDWRNWQVAVSGSAANDGEHRVSSATPHKLIVSAESRINNEAAGPTVTLSCDQQRGEPLLVRAQGKPSPAGGLLENPVEVARDLLLEVLGLREDELDTTSFNRAHRRAAELGYRAAGIVTRPQTAAQVLTGLLGEFLGSWWRGAEGRIKLLMDLGPAGAEEGALSHVFRAGDLKAVSLRAGLEDLANCVEALYRHHPRRGEFDARCQAPQARDLRSIGLHGELARTLELRWVRDPQCAAAICRRAAALLAWPRRIITCEEDALAGIHLERGDLALLSLPWLCDPQGRPLVNQIVRVLSLEPRLDRGTIRFSLMDTGACKTLALRADGNHLADGGQLAGGRRDTTPY